MHAYHVLLDAQQAARIAAHKEIGQSEHKWRQHHHQILYTSPLVHLGMERAGVDGLHLIYLNIFKHLFNYTIHQPLLLDKKKKLVKAYLRENGFFSYDAAADDENPVRRLIGREVKRFLREADIHLPFLLRIAAVPDEVLGDLVQNTRTSAAEIEFDEDEELAVTADELAQESSELPQMMEHAGMWDNFLACAEAAERPWASPDFDDDDYRKTRAVEFFNFGEHAPTVARAYARTGVLSSDIYKLNTELAEWVLHVLCFIVPRQVLNLGDPSRRRCDACESFGAMPKKIITHLTCRRSLRVNGSLHSGANGNTWAQSFKRGYTEQAFWRVCVRAEMIHGAGNARYVQRKDERLKATGKDKPGYNTQHPLVHSFPLCTL
eukprot:201596-Pleurochrysis_carterae.AAC.1